MEMCNDDNAVQTKRMLFAHNIHTYMQFERNAFFLLQLYSLFFSQKKLHRKLTDQPTDQQHIHTLFICMQRNANVRMHSNHGYAMQWKKNDAMRHEF